MVTIVSVSMIVAALLAVVVAQALLANGQVRMSTLQHQLSLEQSAHRQAELAVSQLETPSRIVGAALSQGMTHPVVTELPYVSLSVPLPTPKVTPAPAAPPATSTSSSTGASAGTSSTTTGSGSGTASSTATGTGSSTTTATSTP
jgi:hypothetical protein